MNAAPESDSDQARPGSAFRHFVAAEVRAQMAREPISNRKFAVKFGLKPAWVDRRLNGTTPMDTDDLQFFADALGVSLVDLLREALRKASANTDPWPLNDDPEAVRINRGCSGSARRLTLVDAA